jgi:hypothetical protein
MKSWKKTSMRSICAMGRSWTSWSRFHCRWCLSGILQLNVQC